MSTVISAISSRTAGAASDFTASVGVNTHLDFGSTAYANTAEVEAALSYLGVSHVRDALDAPTAAALFQQVAQQGITFDVFVASGVEPLSWQFGQMDANASIIDRVEGPNESDGWTQSYNGLTGLAATQAMQKDFAALVAGSAALSGTPIIQASLVNVANSAALGDLSAYADYGNIHAYFGTGNPPGSGLATLLQQSQLVSPGLPTIVTEGGYYTSPDPTAGVDDLTEAKGDLNLLFDDWQAGISSTYLYELVDEQSDPGDTNANDHFGLFNNDWTPKPIAVALNALTTIMGNAATPSAGNLAFQVSGLTATGSDMLFERADGSFVVALWNDERSWNAATQTDIVNADIPIVLTLAHSYQSVSIYDLLDGGTTPIATYTDVQTLDLSLPDYPILVVIGPQLAPVQPLFSVLANTAMEGQALGNLWNDIIAAGEALDPGHTLTVQSVDTTATHGGVTFDASQDVLSYQATGSDALHPVDSFEYTLVDETGQTISGVYNVTISGLVMPTIVNTTADTISIATAPGMRLIAEGTGQTLDGSAAGNTAFFAAADTTITAFGSNNTIHALPGNHTINTGAGSATVITGDGNQRVIAPGVGNNITLGNGNSFVAASGGLETVTIAGGTNQVFVTGTNDVVTTGSGDDTIQSTGGQAVIAAGDGNNTITVAGFGNVVTTGSGHDVIGGSSGTSTIDAGAGDDSISFSGSGSTITGGPGNDTIADSGSRNVIVLNAAGQGTDAVLGNLSTNGDHYDLRGALAATNWAGDSVSLAQYVQVSDTNGNATILIDPDGTGPDAASPVAVLHAIGSPTLANFLGMSVLTLAAPATSLSVQEGGVVTGLWGELTALAQQQDPWTSGAYTLTAVNATGAEGAIAFDPADQALTYTATWADPSHPVDTISYTAMDGLGHTVTGVLSIAIEGNGETTLASATPGATLRATMPFMQLVSQATGQTLVGVAGGNVQFFLSSDTRVMALGTGNIIHGAAGNHTISAGSGSATIQLGAGDNSIIASGLGNVITGGDGNTSVSGLQGNATVILGNGVNTVTATGAGNSITVGVGASTINGGSGGSETVHSAGGDVKITLGGVGNQVVTGTGNATITSTGANATLTLGAGTNTVTAQGAGSVIFGGAGDDTIQAHGGTTTVSAGLGNDTIRFSGSGNVIQGGVGNDSLYESGSGNTLVLNPAGQGLDQIFGWTPQINDIFDLRAVMAATSWDGTAASAGNYLTVAAQGSTDVISVIPGGNPGGSASSIAVLHGVTNLTTATLIGHSLLS